MNDSSHSGSPHPVTRLSGIPLPDGQLWPAERAALRAAVLRVKPKLAFEVGTWNGGGSTWQIVSALIENGHGRLHTCEPDFDKFIVAHQFYSGESLRAYCTVHLCRARTVIDLLPSLGIPEFVFFDGGEDPHEVMDDFIALEKLLIPGTVFMAHDWLNGESRKNDLIKPYLESSTGWRIVSVLQPPESVGLVEAIKL